MEEDRKPERKTASGSEQEGPAEEEKGSRSLLHELYKDDPSVAGGSRQLRCNDEA